MSDHQIEIGDEIVRLDLARQDGRAIYEVRPEVPQYRNPLVFSQDNWVGGHGQYRFIDRTKYFEGQSIDTTQDGRIILGPLITEVQEHGSPDTDLDSNPVKFCYFPAVSKWLVATSGEIYLYDSTDNDWDEATTEVAGVTDLKVYGAIAYASIGSGTKYYYSANGTDWTQTDLDYGYAHKIFVAPNPAGTLDVMWGFKQPNELRNTTDGRAKGTGVEWTNPPAYIGDASTNITNMFMVNDNLLIGREDNLYHYDSNGGLHPLRDDLKENRSSENFKYICKWQTGTYFSEIDGVGEITSYNSYSPCGALYGIDNIGKRGKVVGLAADKDWRYEAWDEGANTIIYKGREIRRNGELREEWCPWVFLGTETCADIATCQHSTTDRRLWFGYTKSTAYVKLSDNPTADSNAKFAASGFLRMSYDYGSNPNNDKIWQSVIIETKACSSTQTVTIKYRKDNDTTATTISGAITKNGVHKYYFANPVSCKRIQFEVHLATGSSSATPEVLYFEARGIEKPEATRLHEAIYDVGDEPSERTKTIRDLLRKAGESSQLLRFTDLRYKDTKWIVIEPGYPQEPEMGEERWRSPDLGIVLRFREVDYPND